MVKTKDRSVTLGDATIYLDENDLSALMLFTSAYALPGTCLLTTDYIFTKGLDRVVITDPTGRVEGAVCTIKQSEYTTTAEICGKELFNV